ncbi:MAG TPA: SLC13 family permease [Kofleriaceae bacterium]|nr:SLC13 family permease [Kofleriaceae bacterium]
MSLAGDDAPLGAITPAEARFEARLRLTGLYLGPAAALAVYALTASLTGEQRTLSALMTFCAIYWITEPIPMAATALVAAAGCVLLGVASAEQAFGAFGNPLLFLFVGSFFLAEAMQIHGLGKRLARAVTRLARGRLSLMIALSASAGAMSMWMSNVAATAITLPVAVAVAGALGDRKLATALVLAVAYGASVGGICTPVGTPPNLIGIAALRQAGEPIEFLRWMALCIPLAVLMMLVLWVILSLTFGIRPGQPIPATDSERQPWNRGEVAVVCAFGLAIAGWLVPGIFEAAAPDSAATSWFKAHLTEEVVALGCGCLLFLLPAGTRAAPRPALTWRQAAGIDWGVIILFGGGILLGKLAKTTGLSDMWGTALVSATGAESTWTLTALVTGASILLSEATSNTATATLMAPLAVSLAHAAGVSPVPAALGATLGASFGFMLPISTGPNAMAYASGKVRVRQMVRAGIAFDILGFLIIVGGLRLLMPICGLD